MTHPLIQGFFFFLFSDKVRGRCEESCSVTAKTHKEVWERHPLTEHKKKKKKPCVIKISR